MIKDEINDRLRADEQHGEKLISIIRLIMASIYILSTAAVSVAKHLENSANIPMRSHVCTSIFLLYSIFLFIFVRKKVSLHNTFKYICVFLDMSILSVIIWVSCTYLEISAPLPFLSSRALFYSILILAGSFRYSTPCAYFSGIYGAVSFLFVVFINRNTLDLPYYFLLNSELLEIRFPFYNELFKVFGIIITGIVTGMASKRRLSLFRNMIESEAKTAKAATNTVEKTRDIAQIIRQSIDEIFLSSKNIFSTANNQAASIHEIESTINENMQIANEIAEKTNSIANIASKMKDDFADGYKLLMFNINQMEGIKHKNDGVISGIVELGNKITKIRESIMMINTITEQTKVIAFNAALEAASAGEQGKRFSVVSSEVNRLADDIASLTKQIRSQIEEIQRSSSSLITSSEESTSMIIEGDNLIKDLEEIFYKTRSGADTTSAEAQIITVSTQKQQQSTEQISIAIKDISEGLNNFLRSTGAATSSAENLTRITEKLGNILNI